MALRSLKKLPKLSSFQDKALRSLKKLPKLSSFQDKALRSLKKLPKLSSFQDKALRSLKKLPKLSSFQDQESFPRGQVAKKMDKKKDVFTPIRRKLVLEFTWFKYIFRQ